MGQATAMLNTNSRVGLKLLIVLNLNLIVKNLTIGATTSPKTPAIAGVSGYPIRKSQIVGRNPATAVGPV
jgi:hypothetical protein